MEHMISRLMYLLWPVIDHSRIEAFSFPNLLLGFENFSSFRRVLFYHNGLVLILILFVVISNNVWVL